MGRELDEMGPALREVGRDGLPAGRYRLVYARMNEDDDHEYDRIDGYAAGKFDWML